MKISRKKLFFVLLVLLLAGCKSKESDFGGVEPVETTFGKEVSYFNYAMFIGHGYCDRGAVRTKDGVLMFQEYESALSYPLCSAAYCEHEAEDETCEAVRENAVTACIAGDFLYTFEEETIGTTTVYIRELKGSGYKKVAELPYGMTPTVDGIYNVIRGDRALFIATDYTNLEKSMNWSANEYPTVLLEVNLKSGKYKELFRMDAGPQIRALHCMENGIGLHFMYGVYESDIRDDGTSFISSEQLWNYYYYIDTENGEIKEIRSLMQDDGGEETVNGEQDNDSTVFVGFSEQAVLVKQGKALYWMNPETENKTKVWELPKEYNYFYTGCVGEKTITVYTEGKTGGKRCILLLETGEVFETDYGEGFAGIAHIANDYYSCIYIEDDIEYEKLIHYSDLINGMRKVKLDWIY